MTEETELDLNLASDGDEYEILEKIQFPKTTTSDRQAKKEQRQFEDMTLGRTDDPISDPLIAMIFVVVGALGVVFLFVSISTHSLRIAAPIEGTPEAIALKQTAELQEVRFGLIDDFCAGVGVELLMSSVMLFLILYSDKLRDWSRVWCLITSIVFVVILSAFSVWLGYEYTSGLLCSFCVESFGAIAVFALLENVMKSRANSTSIKNETK